MTMFDASALQLLNETREVRIETHAAEDAPVHRTIIWVVVDEQQRVLVRTYRGAGSRWYREALALGTARLHVAGRVLDVTVEPAGDAERIAACSRGLQRKYAGDPSTPRMVSDAVLDTTLELKPA